MHLVEGTFNVTRHKDRTDEPAVKEPIAKPKSLRGRASKIWDEVMEFAYWLTAADSHTLAMWCRLTAQAEKDFKGFTGSMLSNHRAYGSVLGFDPSSRSHINVGNALGKKTGEKEKTNKFYA
jgi:phage terminase small subunit